MHNADLAQEIKRLNHVINRLYKQQSLWHSFLRGILSGLGSVLGATIIVALIAYLLRNINLVPIIGDWLSQIFANVLQNLPQK